MVFIGDVLGSNYELTLDQDFVNKIILIIRDLDGFVSDICQIMWNKMWIDHQIIHITIRVLVFVLVGMKFTMKKEGINIVLVTSH